MPNSNNNHLREDGAAPASPCQGHRLLRLQWWETATRSHSQLPLTFLPRRGQLCAWLTRGVSLWIWARAGVRGFGFCLPDAKVTDSCANRDGK